MGKRVALFEARSLVRLCSPRHEVFDLRAVGLPQVKAAGLAVVGDHACPHGFSAEPLWAACGLFRQFS